MIPRNKCKMQENQTDQIAVVKTEFIKQKVKGEPQ